jgi:hypothetical protein
LKALLIYPKDSNAEAVPVNAIHYKYDDLPEQVKNQGKVLDIPDQEPYPDKVGVLYINPQTDELWWEYKPKKPTPEEELQQLKERIQLMQQALDDLLLGGM